MNIQKKIKHLCIFKSTTLNSAVKKMNKFGYKSLVVVDSSFLFLGVLSNGDIRRALIKKKKLNSNINSIYNKKSVYLFENKFKKGQIKNIFLKKNIDLIPVVDSQKKLRNILFEKDLISRKKKLIKKKLPPINVMIMAGGKGTRLRPFTSILPKPLLFYKGMPIIEHVIKNFLKYKISNFICSLNYKSYLIKAFFKEKKLPINLKYVEENKPLGTAGSLKLMRNKTRDILITNCDTILNCDLNKILKYHKRETNDLTIICAKIPFQIPYGVVETEKVNILKKINEKPKNSYLVNVGTYLLKSKLISLIPKKDKVYNMTDLISDAKINKKKVGIFIIPRKSWLDLGNLKNLSN